MGLRIIPYDVRTREEVERAFVGMKQDRVQGLFILLTPFFYQLRKSIADQAIKLRLPTVAGRPEYVAAGALMSYGANVDVMYRAAATYVDRILKGAKPGELPVEQPTQFYLVINRSTAKAIGLKVPQDMLARADRIID